MSRRVASVLASIALAWFIGLTMPLSGWAGQGTDGEVIPPEDCTLDPLDTDEAVERLLAPIEIPEEGPGGLPLYVEDEDELPTGDEVGRATQREVEDLVEQFVACTNAGQLLRLMGLYTEDGLPFSLRAPLAVITESDLFTESQKRQFLTQTLEAGLSQPAAAQLPEVLWTALVEVEDAIELDDDLIGVLVVIDSVVDPRPAESAFLVFTEEGGDLLIAGHVFVF
jgi:hypothetical protein